MARNGLLGQFLWPSASHGSGLAIGKEIRSIAPIGSELGQFKEGNRQIEKESRSIRPLGSELWPFKEGKGQICLKIGAFLTLFVNPFSNGHNSGPECDFSKI